MSQSLNASLKRALTIKYAFAGLVIIVLVTTALFVFKAVLSQSAHNAELVNVSGKQRMLSQRITLEWYALVAERNPQQKQSIISDIKRLSSKLNQAHQQLSSGVLAARSQGFGESGLSSALTTMYFGPKGVDKTLQDYLALSQRYLEQQNVTQTQLARLKSKSNVLLHKLDQVVGQYQREGEAAVKRIEWWAEITWLITLLGVVLMMAMVCRPTIKMLLRARSAEQDTIQNLNDIVALRTQKLANKNTQLEQLAQHDVLTGLKNRLTLETNLETLVNAMKQHQQPLALAMLDIDWFKQINDQFGHEVGDHVLKEFANILQDQVRNEDKVYRVGGEEFVITFNRIEQQDALQKMNAMREFIASHAFNATQHPLHLTTSVGLFHSDQFREIDYKAMLKAADTALYQAKALGRNRVFMASPHLVLRTQKPVEKYARLSFADCSLQTLVQVDDEAAAILEQEQNSLLKSSKSFADWVYKDDLDQLEKLCEQLKTGHAESLILRLCLANDVVIIVRINAVLENQQPTLYMQKASELAKSLDDTLLLHNFYALLDRTDDYIYFKDRNHVLTAASATMVNVTNVKHRDEFVGKTDYEVFPRLYADEYFGLEKQVFSGQTPMAQAIQPFEDEAEGYKGWVDNRKYPIKDSNGEIIGLFGVARIIEKKPYQKASVPDSAARTSH